MLSPAPGRRRSKWGARTLFRVKGCLSLTSMSCLTTRAEATWQTWDWTIIARLILRVRCRWALTTSTSSRERLKSVWSLTCKAWSSALTNRSRWCTRGWTSSRLSSSVPSTNCCQGEMAELRQALGIGRKKVLSPKAPWATPLHLLSTQLCHSTLQTLLIKWWDNIHLCRSVRLGLARTPCSLKRWSLPIRLL